jgi:hypothetical protein
MEDADVLAAEVAQQGEGGAPAFPDARKSRSRSYSHGQAGVPYEEGTTPEDARLVKFQENGILEGISKRRFRFVFGGVVMGLFVSTQL